MRLTQPRPHRNVDQPCTKKAAISLELPRTQDVVCDTLVHDCINGLRHGALIAVECEIPAAAFSSHMLTHVTRPHNAEIAEGIFLVKWAGSDDGVVSSAVDVLPRTLLPVLSTLAAAAITAGS